MEMQNGRAAKPNTQFEGTLSSVIRPQAEGPRPQDQEVMREATSLARRERDPDSAERSPRALESGSEDEYFREDAAPKHAVPNRLIGAVEVPMIVMNLDRAEKAFGSISTFENVMDLNRMSIPFYLNPESPFRRPIMSHNAATHNVVLKVTVPKRTGRKRKRGSNDPFESEMVTHDAEAANQPRPKLCSQSRLDNPRVLRRRLQDNVDKYRIEVAGVVKSTHRFRALADFQWNMDQSPFITAVREQILSGDVSKIKEFRFREGTDFGPNVELIPPPAWTPAALPFNYGYAQNPYVRPETDHTGQQTLVNTQIPTLVGYFLSADQYPIPTGPQFEYDGSDPDMTSCIAKAKALMEDRPIWTRRSLLNALGSDVRNSNIVKRCAGFVGYQFRGGPFRDAVIKYGVDPRSDPTYRQYQTMLFNMRKLQPGYAGETWQGLRSIRTEQRQPMGDNFESHKFDGKSFWTDSKVWQICDITEPVLRRIVEESPVRPACSITSSGWFHGTTWAKLKATMKTKMLAIQFGRKVPDESFDAILAVKDETPEPGAVATHLPLPDLHLTEEEMRTIYGKNWKMPKKKKRPGFDFRIPGPKGERQSTEVGYEAQGDGTSFGYRAGGQGDGYAFQEDILELAEGDSEGEGADDDEDDEDEDVGAHAADNEEVEGGNLMDVAEVGEHGRRVAPHSYDRNFYATPWGGDDGGLGTYETPAEYDNDDYEDEDEGEYEGENGGEDEGENEDEEENDEDTDDFDEAMIEPSLRS